MATPRMRSQESAARDGILHLDAWNPTLGFDAKDINIMSTTAVHPTPPSHGDQTNATEGGESPLQRLKRAIDHAAHLLPAQGPITVFIHHNTLHAFEDAPFEEAVEKGARIFGCQPYLSEDRYREELGRGRIRFAELEDVLRESLGDRAQDSIADLCTRLELRLAMLEYPLLTGPTGELVWFVAETDALRKIRKEASSSVRGQLIAETRRWVMRDLRGGNEAHRNGTAAKRRTNERVPDALVGLFARFGESALESWSEEDWEGFTLQALWRICCEGVHDIPPELPPAPIAERHRDLLLKATGEDIDPLVNEVLIRFCAAFLDQGFAHWQLPRQIG